MSDQPIIIEQSGEILNDKSSSNSKDSQSFFKLLDQVQNYDSLAIEIKKKYEQAMLLFASIKFNNPYALTANSHRCLPAFLTINNNSTFETGYVPFNQLIDQDQYPQEFEQQQQIEKQCFAKNEQIKGSDQSKVKIINQSEPLYRFNVLNQQTQVISAAHKFRELMESLLKLINAKKHIQKTFNQMEQNTK